MNLIAKTLYGLEKVLAEELENLGASDILPANRAVKFSGSKKLLYMSNYSLRSALSVLVNISDFRIRSKDDLYDHALKIDWSEIMDSDSTFSVTPVVNSKLFSHTGYPALVVKDAIADHFRRRTGKRPVVDLRDPALEVNLHISNDQVNISLDSSGPSLFKRGYRTGQGPAPVNEVLAAGILLLSGWDGTTPLLDPMCGSGTFPIEAGMIACRIPPGKIRKNYGFTRWKDFNQELFEQVKKECDSQVCRAQVRITGSDKSEQAVEQSLTNVKNAGLEGEIEIKMADFCDLKAGHSGEYLFLNPPYGQRLKPEEITGLYSMIGSTLKHSFPGCRAWIITSEKEYLKNIGLKPASRHILFNGSIECILYEFVMYEGSLKRAGLRRNS